MKLPVILSHNLSKALRKYHPICFSTTACNNLFYEDDPKDGYNKDKRTDSYWAHIKRGWGMLGGELQLFKKEIIEKFQMDPLLYVRAGSVHKQWELRKHEHLEDWIITADSDHGEGFSTCSLAINSYGVGHFSGVLDAIVPKDGIIKKAGYCAIKTKGVMKSFQRDSCLNWTMYTHVILKVRGDGRSYMINIANAGRFDLLWHDMFHYILYTRGGPYWQITKIPFSKFFYANKGTIQDRQRPVDLENITHFGITAGDKVNGPFSLEIDYIGLMYDPTHCEEFAYEMYQIPRYIAAT